jgi:hypothetical protein
MTGIAVDIFERWDGGNYGVLQGFRAPKATFSGDDVQAYLDGSVGPRCGVTPIVSTGMPVGRVAGMGYFGRDASSATWYVIGTAVFSNLTTPGAGLTGGLAVTPTRAVQGAAVGSLVYIANYGDKIYSLSTTAITAVAGTPGAGTIINYGDRLLAANSPGLGNRVRFSDGNLFNSWPAGNFFDVGQGGEITGMWTVRESVYIAKNDGTWWLYSGVPGSGNDVLRLAYTGFSYPADFLSGAVIGGNNVWYVANGENFPSWFNGSNVNTVAEQDTLLRTFSTVATDVQSKVNLVPMSRRGDMIILAGDGLTDPKDLLYRDGKWSRHTVPYSLGATVPGATGRVLLCDGGDTGTPATFAYWQAAGFERPGLGGTYDAVTDANLMATVVLPEGVDDKGRSQQVVQVRVDFRRFNPSTTAVNRLDCQVTATRREDDADDADMPIQTWTQPPSHGSAAGEPLRHTFQFGAQADGVGYLVQFPTVRGVVIDRVTVFKYMKEARL